MLRALISSPTFDKTIDDSRRARIAAGQSFAGFRCSAAIDSQVFRATQFDLDQLPELNSLLAWCQGRCIRCQPHTVNAGRFLELGKRPV